MPGKVRVKIIAGRNLPIMDRGSDTTDAYVEIKLANTTYKTDVYRKSLNPQWNSDFYRFELDDAELQDEPLQIRLMDYDTYSANDAIGKVNICLNPLLLPSFDMTGQVIRTGKGAVMSGWIPVFDTCKGIRGEVNLIVKVDLFSDVNKFRQSSCGVQFFHSSIIPYGYVAQTIHGFVEELVVNDDPEYQWIDKIRTPRASNEARQVVFLKLSGQVQRKIGLKAIDLGANAVIGYVQCFDLEGDVGVVARGTGTAVTLVKINESITQPTVDTALLEEQLKYLEFLNDGNNPDNFSKFDAHNYPSNSGDIVYKILGINQSTSPNKSTSIVLNKKTKRQDKQSDTHDMILEEPIENLENLKILVAQEENRRENFKERLGVGIRKMGKSSKNILQKRRNPFKRTDRQTVEIEEMSQGESTTDITRAPSTSSLRTSFTDIRGILKSSISGKPKYQRSSSDGVGMAALLVSSMIAAPSLDCISETNDSPKASPAKSDQHKSESLTNLPTSKSYKSEKNSFLKPQFEHAVVDIKTSDSNLSSNLSISSCTGSTSSCNEEEDLSEDQEDVTKNEIVLVDADTVSMVVKSVLAQEESQLESNNWIDPTSPATSSSSSSSDEQKSILIKQSSTETPRRDSDSTTMLRTGVTRFSKDKSGNISARQVIEVESNVNEMGRFLNAPNPDEDADNWIQPGSTTDEPECVDTRRGSIFKEFKENFSEKLHSIQEHMHLTHHQPDEIRNKHGLISTAMDTILIEQATILGAKPSLNTVNILRHDDEKRRSSIDSLKKRITSLYKRSSDTEKSELKHESGLVGTAMKTMLLETANVTEEMVAHPLNNPPKADVAPFASLNNSKRPSIIEVSETLNSYGSAIEFGDITEQQIQPFLSLIDLKNAIKIQSNKPLFVVQNPTESYLPPQDSTNPQCYLPRNVDNTQDCASCDSNTTNKASLLVPAPLPVNRSNADFVGSPKTVGHIRAESTGGKMSQSPSKGMVTGSQSATVASSSKEPIFRRSSDSDLSVTPKVRGRKRNSLSTTAERPERLDTTLKTPFNHDNLDMLEYPFLTMSKYPQGFILHLGATVCSRSVKLLERVPNPDEPETRDSWWKELRMEVRSHARALNCNVILGYTEVTTISDDVCVLSVTGTAAVINPKYTFETVSILNKMQAVPVGSAPKDINHPLVERSDIDKDNRKVGILKEVAHPLPINDKVSTKSITIPDIDETEVVSTKIIRDTGCTLCHIPYRKSSTFDMHTKKCTICKLGDVPDILLITIELPDSIQITGRGCFVQAQVCRTKKDLKSESNAKEISDAIPFLEYEIHRLLVNKIKSKGMNALFGMKSTIAIGERVIALIATGTAVYLPSLPAPLPPKIVAGNSWSNSDKIRELQKQLKQTFDRNREIYQLKSAEELELESKNATSDDMYLKDIEPNEIDLTNGGKDACVLEVDDIEDLEIIALLMEPSPPDGFHVVNTCSVPGLHDLEVIRNLQMFVQVYRAKLGLNQQASNFPKHFQRLVQTIYFKIRSMIPCAICDFRFRLDFPESEEIQILVTGMALGLGEPSRLTKYKRKVAAHPQTKESKRLADDELIFNLEEEELTEQLTQSLTFPTSSKTLTQTGSLKLKKSPNRGRFNSVRLAKHVPLRERFGVDLTPLCYVPGGKIDKYLGNLNFFFIRESTSVKENGGISGFVHSFITEVLAIVRANVTALGGNAMVSFYMTEMILVDNPHKNQGQCLISVGGDVVFVSYFSDE